MRYLSVCSGIEAATVAWHPLGWEAAAFSEIEKFPRAVLQHHYPTVPLHGDFTTIRGDEYGSVQLLVGGTPCQDFSAAGLRAGIAGERGNLTLEFLRLAARKKPRWIVWENVPGVLSSDGGRALGAFLGGLAELGYGFAYRVLDAQYFGLAQRRARVFVVGHLGDWRRAAAVLFERESLLGHPPPSREAGQGIANSLTERPDRGGGNSEGQRLIARCDTAREGSRQDYETETLIAHSLRAEGFDASEDGTGRGTPLIAFTAKDHGADAGCIAPTLRGGGHHNSHANGGVMPAVAFIGGPDGKLDDGTLARTEDMPAGAMRGVRQPESRGASQGRRLAQQRSGQFGASLSELPPEGASAEAQVQPVRRAAQGAGVLQQAPDPLQAMGRPSRNESEPKHAAALVRRLTPRECERLQGFPDDYTLIPYRGKPAADGPRYKALGNSMAVPIMGWLGRRIQMVEDLIKETSNAA